VGAPIIKNMKKTNCSKINRKYKAIGLRYCSCCKKLKSISNFYFLNKKINKLSCWCKTCDKKSKKIYRNENKDIIHKKQKAWYIKNRKELLKQQKLFRKSHPTYQLNIHLKHKFGITLDQYNQMLESQNGVCAICNNFEIEKNQYGIKRLSVDHNHQTGKIRGLLCTKCNTGLSFFKDKPDLLIKANNYLVNYGT
jgi:hypothetical protein